jgi:CO/xanthine dehydrogenase FAD-binding subunit
MMRSEIDVLTPQSLEEALELLHQNHDGLKIIAGGSDVIVQLRDGIIKTNKLLNIQPLKELRYIRKTNGQLHIGSLTTYSDIVESALTRNHAWVLADAARQIGAIQLQNTATIGGNLGNASPAGDSLPPLYALNARVVTRSKSGRREIPIEDFFVGYRKVALRPDELIEEVYFDALNKTDRGSYVKLGLREANAISIVDIAAVLRGRNSDGFFADAKVALGAVAPTIRLARGCEQALLNRTLDDETLWKAASLAVADAAPISDIRGSAEYRKDVVVSLVYQALHEAVFGRVKTNE